MNAPCIAHTAKSTTDFYQKSVSALFCTTSNLLSRKVSVQLMWHMTMQRCVALGSQTTPALFAVCGVWGNCWQHVCSLRQLTSGTPVGNQHQAPQQSSSSSSTLQQPETLEFPGGTVPFTSSMQFMGSALTPSSPRIPCYRTLDGTGRHIPDAAVPHDLDQQMATDLYTAMAKLQVMDTICYDAQRQVW